MKAVGRIEACTPELMLKAKRMGFVDRQLATYPGARPTAGSARPGKAMGVTAVYKSVDTCAAEFEAYTPYYYSTYESPVMKPDGPRTEDEVRPFTNKKRIMILGGGPNRIGQGIEFDYCCCQAAFHGRSAGAGLRSHHGQLEPRDRQHRLRHQRPLASSSSR